MERFVSLLLQLLLLSLSQCLVPTQSRLITDLLCSALQLPVRPTSRVVLYRIDPDWLVSIRKVVVSVDFANYEIYERERYLDFLEQ